MTATRLLVANRGEIACRIFRACRDMGIETVAVFSDADRDAPHVAMADYAARIGPPPARESYLSVPAILEAARKTRATLVHPGYGFLAENAGFARACAGAGLVFVGPKPESIEAMGSKTGSRQLMEKAGVPVVPGTLRPAEGADELKQFAKKAGYPVLLKASAGGGGKGMRRVDSDADLDAAFARVSSEAKSAFGDGAVYAEKLIERPRHIEVQVLGENGGRVTAVGERECSLQRRHQKVVEEAPAPALSDEVRETLHAGARLAAQAIGYVGAGTVEFMVSGTKVSFLEMNTRLQVEHPVTEEVWGVDLAAAMIAIALGGSPSFDPSAAAPRGHAIECRVYAEDPRRGFAPAPGRIDVLRLPQGPGVRHDMGIEEGSVVPIDYDPMLGKLVVHGADRRQAIARLSRALAEYEIGGVETTLPLFRALAADPGFAAAEFDVQWLERRLAEGLLAAREASAAQVLLAAAALPGLAGRNGASGEPPAGRGSIWIEAARRESLRDR